MAGPLALHFDLLARDQASAAFNRVGAAAQASGRHVSGFAGAAEQSSRRSRAGVRGMAGTVGVSAGLVGGAVLGIAGRVGGMALSMVRGAATFETTMRQTAVATGAPASAIAGLSKLAIKMGQDTTFSAQDAGGAMLELAKGGLSAADIKAGALASTLTLASAGGIDLGQAAGDVVTGLSLFNLSASQSASVAAALAGAANASQASVSDMGMALSQVGPGARNAGLSLQETTGVLAAFAKNGILGSDAGTSLKTMLTRLVPTTTAARKEMKTLGLDFTDAHGKFLPIGDVAQQLKAKLSGLSQEQRSTALSTIFGSDATRAATVLMGEGSAGIAGFVRATSDKTQADKLAAAATSGTSGALSRMSGAIHTAKLLIGTALEPAVVSIANHLADWSGKIGTVIGWMQQHKTITQALAIGLGVVLVGSIVAVNVALLMLAANPVTLTIMAVVGAVALMAAGFKIAWDKSDTFKRVVLINLSLIAKGAKLLFDFFVGQVEGMLRVAATIAEKLHLPFAKGLRSAQQSVTGFRQAGDREFDRFANYAAGQAAKVGQSVPRGLAAALPATAAQSRRLAALPRAALMDADTRTASIARAMGENAGDALARGMAAKQTLVNNIAAGLGYGAARNIARALDQRSPSRVTHRHGENFGQGFANGIASMQSHAEGVARSLGVGTAAAMAGMSTTSPGALAGMATRQARGSFGGGTTITNNMTINIDGGSYRGTDAARNLARDLEPEIRALLTRDARRNNRDARL